MDELLRQINTFLALALQRGQIKESQVDGLRMQLTILASNALTGDPTAAQQLSQYGIFAETDITTAGGGGGATPAGGPGGLGGPEEGPNVRTIKDPETGLVTTWVWEPPSERVTTNLFGQPTVVRTPGQWQAVGTPREFSEGGAGGSAAALQNAQLARERFEKLEMPGFEFQKQQYLANLARSPGDYLTYLNMIRGGEPPNLQLGGEVIGGIRRNIALPAGLATTQAGGTLTPTGPGGTLTEPSSGGVRPLGPQAQAGETPVEQQFRLGAVAGTGEPVEDRVAYEERLRRGVGAIAR